MGQSYVFTRVCDSVHGGYPSMHCRWYPSMPCSRSPGGIPACLASFQAHTQGEKWSSLAWGGVSRPTPVGRGGSPGPHPVGSTPTPRGLQAHTQGGLQADSPRRILLRAVRILLECILVIMERILRHFCMTKEAILNSDMTA